jgi:hypothetical protein
MCTDTIQKPVPKAKSNLEDGHLLIKYDLGRQLNYVAANVKHQTRGFIHFAREEPPNEYKNSAHPLDKLE